MRLRSDDGFPKAMSEPKRRNRHFVVTIEVVPGDRRRVRMTIDTGTPRWARFRIYRSRRTFAIPLSELVGLGIRRAQVRYVEKELTTIKEAAPPADSLKSDVVRRGAVEA